MHDISVTVVVCAACGLNSHRMSFTVSTRLFSQKNDLFKLGRLPQNKHLGKKLLTSDQRYLNCHDGYAFGFNPGESKNHLDICC